MARNSLVAVVYCLDFHFSQTVSHAVAQCQPRARISQSGILPVLAQLLPHQTDFLTPLHVEFLQACIYAEQYRYAERWVTDTWPRPCGGGVSVEQVLRYYYLRGTVHLACEHFELAIRCFWTCLSIPADVPSKIVIAAWKKLVLIQCLVAEDVFAVVEQDSSDKDKINNPLLSLPKVLPACMNRLINQATSVERRAEEKSAASLPAGAPPEEMVPPAGGVVHMVEASLAGDQGGEFAVDIGSSPSGPAEEMRIYIQLANAYNNVDRVAFEKLQRDHETTLAEDQNTGLVFQCSARLIRRHVFLLSSIYSVISLTQLAELLQLDEIHLQRLLLKISMDKVWPIEMRVDGATTFVVFPPRTENVAFDTNQLVQLSYLIRNLDTSVASSSKYTSMLRKDGNRKNRESSPAGPRGVEDI